MATIYAILDTLISDLYPDNLPENTALPATIYEINDVERVSTLDGISTNSYVYEVELTTFGNTRLETVTELDRIMDIIKNFKGTVSGEYIQGIKITNEEDDQEGLFFIKILEIEIHVN